MEMHATGLGIDLRSWWSVGDQIATERAINEQLRSRVTIARGDVSKIHVPFEWTRPGPGERMREDVARGKFVDNE